MTLQTKKVILPFTKAEALGNDFVIAHNVSKLSDEQRLKLASRRRGIGCDQIISIEDGSIAGADFIIRFYNADGSMAGACGNGSRAVAGFYAQKTNKSEFFFAVENNIGEHAFIHALMGQGSCRLSMPQPTFDPCKIPLKSEDIQSFSITLDILSSYSGMALSVGNPHIVYIVNDAETIPLAEYGPMVENHDFFPERINVEFVHIIDRQNIRMRVWERGSGITEACGTGACASAIAAIKQGYTDKVVHVHCDGGMLTISYNPANGDLFMEGAYNLVFEGEISL